MKRRLAYIPLHRFSLVMPAELYRELQEQVPDEQSITEWIIDAIQAKLVRRAEAKKEG